MTEPRIAPASIDDTREQIAAVMRAAGAGDDADPGPIATYNVFRTMATHPDLFAAWLPLGGFLLSRGTLAPRDRELMILRTAVVCLSSYEWGQHARISSAIGISDDEIARVAAGADAEGWSEREASLLRAVDELAADKRISDATWAALGRTYDARQMAEATMLIGHYTMVAYCLNSFGVELDEGLDPLPGS